MTTYQRLSLFAVLFVFVCAGVYAQETTGNISGVVKDETGGVLPGVEVTARNTGTEATRTVISDDEGRYRLVQLAPGDYELRAGLSGFQTAVLQGISLSLAQKAVVAITLSVGSISEQVVVSAEVSLVETTSATVAALVESNQIRNLPLNGRDFIQLAALQEGVVVPLAANRGVTGNTGVKISIAGAQPHDNAFLLDGTDIKNQHGSTPGSISGVLLGVETIREFRVLTSAYTAEYGRFSGGVITAVTKSGTNELHGSLFEYHRNSALDARNFFDRNPNNVLEREKPPNFIRNQFGFTLGGPIVKDRTFFFGSYEGLRERLTTTDISNFPNKAARGGITPWVRRGSSQCSGSQHLPGPDGVLGATSRGRPVRGDPFADDDLCQFVIPARMQPYIDLYPIPNGPDNGNGSAQFLFPNSQPTDEDYGVIKVDHRFSESDDFFARYTGSDAEATRSLESVLYGRLETTHYQYVTLEEKHIFSPSLLNEFRFGFTRSRQLVDEFESPGYSIDPSLWFVPKERSEEANFNGGVGLMNCRGCAIDDFGTTTGAPGRKVLNTFQFNDNLVLTRGSHSLKVGGNLTRFQYNWMGSSRLSGSYLYNSLADLLQARFLEASVHFGDFEDQTKMSAGLRQSLIGFYIQDDFQFRPNLTFNLGLRYEFITSPTEVNGRLGNLQDPLQTVPDIGNPYFANPSLKNFSPRIGFAWDPTGSGKTSIRGGFGLFHQQILQWAYLSSVFRSSPFALRAGVEATSHNPTECGGPRTNGVDCNDIFLNLDFEGQTNPDTGEPYIAFPDIYRVWDNTHPGVLFPNFDPVSDPQQPYLMQWSLTLQREIVAGMAVTATYAGSRGVHNTRIADHNRPTGTFLNGAWVYECESTTSSSSRPQCVAPRANSFFLQMKDRRWDANSWYHALKLGLRKRFSAGFSYQLSYQFQKSMDQASGISGVPSEISNGQDLASNWLDHRIDQGLSSYHVPHVFSANWTWELPFGPGRSFGSGATGVVSQLIQGWSLTGILNLSDGAPINMEGGARLTCSVCSRLRPNLAAGGTNSPETTGEPTAWFGEDGADNFELSLPIKLDGTECGPNAGPGECIGVYGNVGRNTAVGPGAASLDFAIHKGFSVGENALIQFRAEFFNIMNRTNFGNPRRSAFTSSGSADGNFGQIVRTSTTSRQIQFALRVEF